MSSEIPKDMDALEAMRSKEEHQTPLMKSMNESVSTEEKLGISVFYYMKQLIDKGIDPAWGTFQSSKGGLLISMNLTGSNLSRFKDKWEKIYNDLMSESPENQNATKE